MFEFIKKIFHHLEKRRRWQLLAVVSLMIAGALAEAFTLGAVVPFLGLLASPDFMDKLPWFAEVLDRIAALVGGTRVLAASVLFGCIAFFSGVLRLLLNWSSNKLTFAIGSDLGALVFSKVLHQPYAYHLRQSSSQTLSAVEKVAHMTMGALAPLMLSMAAIVMIVSILSALLWVNTEVALIAGGIIGGLYYGISLWAKKRLYENGQNITKNFTLRYQYLQEGLGAIRDITLEHSHDVYVEQFSNVDQIASKNRAINTTLASAPKYVIESLAIILVVILANWLVHGSGGMADALPVLGALALGGQRLLPHVQTIYNGYASYRGTLATSQETLALLDLPIPDRREVEKSIGHDAQTPVGRVELRGVHFTYDGSQKPVLNGVNLRIDAGERVGFVGVTGGGKSTLLDICMGLLRPTSGAVVVNGEPITEANLPWWHKRIAHVPQAIFLVDKSIAENVALGVPPGKIDHAHLAQALEAAQLSEFIRQLPEGARTRVGERGVQLSGGQRQRIGIARALYKKADVLVLDEATSALDGETEARVMDAIYRLNPNVIILMIAHRVSTLARCNKLYRLDGGRVYPATQPEIHKNTALASTSAAHAAT